MARPKKAPLTEMQKIAKKIGDDGESIIAELEAMEVVDLNKRISQATQSISDTKKELDQNEEYVSAREDVKLLSSGFREVKKRQGAIIAVCIQLRKDKGAV